jgi:3-phenylpropionate/trans-cinnamate dioxygenase ferredoxin reductase component
VGGGVVIVGASLAGLRLAESVRTVGYSGAITIVGAEVHKPYNRPPLSKDVLLSQNKSAGDVLQRLAFSVKPSLADVTWRLGVAATALDIDRRCISLSDGSEIAFEVLGIATGLTPRRLPFEGGDLSRHVVRTVDDAIRLRAALVPGARVVVAGAGFIGCEVAACAMQLGCHVTIVEPLDAPMMRAIGAPLGQAIRQYHETTGIVFRTGVMISGLNVRPNDADHLSAVMLSDGSELLADVLVEATGSVCNSQWLQGSPLKLSDGVETNNHLAATEDQSIVAVGDIVAYPNPRYDATPRRVEHWVIPALTAKRAAATLVSTLLQRDPDPQPFAPLPSFWSDQFGLRLQSIGMPGLADRSDVLEGSLGMLDVKGQGVAVGYFRGDAMIGVIGIGLSVQRLNDYRTMLN